jgi:hypothetical protein
MHFSSNRVEKRSAHSIPSSGHETLLTRLRGVRGLATDPSPLWYTDTSKVESFSVSNPIVVLKLELAQIPTRTWWSRAAGQGSDETGLGVARIFVVYGPLPNERDVNEPVLERSQRYRQMCPRYSISADHSQLEQTPSLQVLWPFRQGSTPSRMSSTATGRCL